MEATFTLILISIVVAAWAAKLLNMLWFRPRKLEKFLRGEGFRGNSYRPFLGDMKDYVKATKAEEGRSIGLSDDIIPHLYGYYHEIISKYGRNSFLWFGPWPRLNVSDPEVIREILRRPDVFEKPFQGTGKILTGGGLLFLEGEQWAKRRKIVNQAFHLEKLKDMVPAIAVSCRNTVEKLKGVVASSSNPGWAETNIWPYLEDLTGDVISRAAFGSSFEEGRRIFELQRERVELGLKLLQFSLVPGWKFLPTKVNRRVRSISTEIQTVLRDMIHKKEKAMGRGEVTAKKDLLSIMMEANQSLVQEHGDKDAGMSVEDIIEECQLFYFAGSETTASLLVWTMVCLCKHPEWQTQAREEVIRVFGKSEPTFQGLNHLKTVTMILQEVQRMYPSGLFLVRAPTETVKVGSLTIPAGVHLTLLLGLLHYDANIWGDDVKEFKPQRFAGGVSSATKTQSSFIPFGAGPRMCIGHNFAMTEAKLAVAMLLQHFSFELSPSYIHAPFAIITLQPQYGVPVIIRRLE